MVTQAVVEVVNAHRTCGARIPGRSGARGGPLPGNTVPARVADGTERRETGVEEISVDEAKSIVAAAEAAYQALDIEAAMALYGDGATIIMNGEKVADGLDEIRVFHERMFGSIMKHKLTKTFRAVTGDVIGVQWHTESLDKDGKSWVQDAGEFWTMENGKLKIWEAHAPPPRPRAEPFEG